VKLRSAEQQADLSEIRVRDALVRTRTLLVNLARGLAKEAACRLPASITKSFGQRSLAVLPQPLRFPGSETGTQQSSAKHLTQPAISWRSLGREAYRAITCEH
jgi:hypothetical protein